MKKPIDRPTWAEDSIRALTSDGMQLVSCAGAFEAVYFRLLDSAGIAFEEGAALRAADTPADGLAAQTAMRQSHSGTCIFGPRFESGDCCCAIQISHLLQRVAGDDSVMLYSCGQHECRGGGRQFAVMQLDEAGEEAPDRRRHLTAGILRQQFDNWRPPLIVISRRMEIGQSHPHSGGATTGQKLGCGWDTFASQGWQQAQLRERRSSRVITTATVCGIPFQVFPGVYGTGRDTESIVTSVVIRPEESFIEIGCGTGAISIHLALKAREGVGIDVNPAAVANSQHNANELGVSNVNFRLGDVFQDITSRFDVVLFNPPFTCRPARDEVEKMFWDPADQAKRAFLEGARHRLQPGGRVYLGWADYAGLNSTLPIEIAAANGLVLTNTSFHPSKSGLYQHQVLEFRER
jgi:SAM-dependent methyltransferase